MSNVIKFPSRRYMVGMKVPELKKDLVKIGFFPNESAIPEGFAEFFIKNLQVCYDTGRKEGINEKDS